jgi:WD40 repeat protein
MLHDENILKTILESLSLHLSFTMLDETKSKIISIVLLKLQKYDIIYKSLGKSSTLLVKHENSISKIALLSNGNIISVKDSSLKVWDTTNNTCTEITNMSINVSSLSCLPGDIIIVYTDNKIQLWDLKKEIKFIKDVDLGKYTLSATNPILLTNGCLAISTMENGFMAISTLEVDYAASILILDYRNNDSNNIVKVLTEYVTYSHILVNLPNGRFASGSCSGNISIWDINDNYRCIISEDHNCAIWSFAFNEKYNLLFTGFGDSTIKLFKIDSLKCVASFNTSQGGVAHILLLPGGYLISAFYDIKVWNMTNYQCINKIERKGMPLLSLLLLKDKRLASCSLSMGIKIFNY